MMETLPPVAGVAVAPPAVPAENSKLPPEPVDELLTVPGTMEMLPGVVPDDDVAMVIPAEPVPRISTKSAEDVPPLIVIESVAVSSMVPGEFSVVSALVSENAAVVVPGLYSTVCDVEETDTMPVVAGELPVESTMFPLVVPVTVPVRMETAPEDPVVPVPVLRTRFPLEVDPAFAVEMLMEPEVLPEPLTIDTAPPVFVLAVTWPACRTSAPPTAESVVPTAMLTAPAAEPPVTGPEVINTVPEEALTAVPLDRVIVPDVPPALAALADRIVIFPVVADVLDPDRSMTSPPDCDAATAAPPCTRTAPPTDCELCPATTLTAPPVADAPAAVPTVKTIAPVTPEVVVPVLNTNEPLDPVELVLEEEIVMPPVDPLWLEPPVIDTAPPTEEEADARPP